MMILHLKILSWALFISGSNILTKTNARSLPLSCALTVFSASGLVAY